MATQATLFDTGSEPAGWELVGCRELPAYQHPRLPGLTIIRNQARCHYPYSVRGAGCLGTFRTLAEAKARAELVLDPRGLVRLAGEYRVKADRLAARAAELPQASRRCRDALGEVEWIRDAADQLEQIAAEGFRRNTV